MFSYQARVADQIARLSRGAPNWYSPLVVGAFTLARDGEMPLWALPFDQKDCELLEERFELTIQSVEALEILGLKGTCDFLELEREIVLDFAAKPALVERLIQGFNGSNKREVYCVSTLAFNHMPSKQIYCLNWQTTVPPSREHPSDFEIPGVRSFVTMNLPIPMLAGQSIA